MGEVGGQAGPWRTHKVAALSRSKGQVVRVEPLFLLHSLQPDLEEVGGEFKERIKNSR